MHSRNRLKHIPKGRTCCVFGDKGWKSDGGRCRLEDPQGGGVPAVGVADRESRGRMEELAAARVMRG